MPKSMRRLSRRKAFQILYGLIFVPAKTREALTTSFETAPKPPKDGELADKSDEFAWELVLGVWQESAKLDEIITRFSQHWKITRIAKIELTILRLALFEMLHRPDIPLKVAINEAVELAKTFGDENSGNFVNGILDAAAKSIEHGDFGIHKGL